jgi:ribosome maturation factor RimP
VTHAIDKPGLIRLLEAPLAALGYELVDIDLRVGSNGLLRLYIDAEGGVTLDDCELASRQISAFLDVEDPMPGRYVLEVSSPGIERRLRTVEHFRRFVNEEVKIQLARPQDGRRRFRGRLTDVDEEAISVVVDGVACRLPFEDIAMATLVPQL